MTIPLTYQAKVPASYRDTLYRVIEALQEEGFGVLTQIDVKATLKEKLGADFRPYMILGACNPVLAHQALTSEPQVGALLPCNVTVEETEKGTLVSIINPEAMLGFPSLSENAPVHEVAAEAKTRLTRVLEALRAASA